MVYDGWPIFLVLEKVVPVTKANQPFKPTGGKVGAEQ